MYDFEHFGRERMDLVNVLQKFRVSPPLDGFGLLDALTHGKLVREGHAELRDPMYMAPTTFSSYDEIKMDLFLKLKLMQSLVTDNQFIPNNCALSYFCDLNLTHVVEKGQQKRIINCLFRDYHRENIKQVIGPGGFAIIVVAHAFGEFSAESWIAQIWFFENRHSKSVLLLVVGCK